MMVGRRFGQGWSGGGWVVVHGGSFVAVMYADPVDHHMESTWIFISMRGLNS